MWYTGRQPGEQKSPHDDFSVIILVDTLNFKGGGYTTQGVSLQLIVSRTKLEEFHRELSAELADFKERHRHDELTAEIFGLGVTDGEGGG